MWRIRKICTVNMLSVAMFNVFTRSFGNQTIWKSKKEEKLTSIYRVKRRKKNERKIKRKFINIAVIKTKHAPKHSHTEWIFFYGLSSLASSCCGVQPSKLNRNLCKLSVFRSISFDNMLRGKGMNVNKKSNCGKANNTDKHETSDENLFAAVSAESAVSRVIPFFPFRRFFSTWNYLCGMLYVCNMHYTFLLFSSVQLPSIYVFVSTGEGV